MTLMKFGSDKQFNATKQWVVTILNSQIILHERINLNLNFNNTLKNKK